MRAKRRVIRTWRYSAAIAAAMPFAALAQNEAPPPAAPAAASTPAASPAADAAPAAPTPPPTPPQPGDDIMAEFYGNTLIDVDGGFESHFYYQPDHTFTATVPAFFMRLKGTWTVKEGNIVCRVFDPPPPTVTNPDCGPMRVRHLGDESREANGDSQKLVPGIQ